MDSHDTSTTHAPRQNMQIMARTLATIRTVGVILLLAILPLHAFIATTAKPLLAESTLFTLLIAWKEVLAIALLGLMSIEIMLHERSFRLKKLDILDATLILYTAIALIFGLTQQTTFAQWAFGARIDLLPFVFLLFCRQVQWPNIQKITITVLTIGLITAVFGILQSVAMPQNWLSSLGYSQNTYSNVPGAGLIATGTTTSALSSCPLLEHSSTFCRAISTFGGPTRFGVYILVIIGLILGLRKIEKSEKWHQLWRVAVVICTVAAILTFSRSVWIGLLAIISVWSLLKWGKRAVVVGLTGIVIVGVMTAFALSLKDSPQHQNPLKSILTRSGSSSKHYEYLVNGFNALKQNPLGQGVGTVGPAADRYTPFLTENWFLQIFVEMGVFGGIVFLAFMGALLRVLYKAKKPLSWGVLLGLVGVCVAGIFTHSFEELGASYTLMILGSVSIATTERSEY